MRKRCVNALLLSALLMTRAVLAQSPPAITTYSLPEATFSGPIVGPDGALWFGLETLPGTIGRMTTNGAFSKFTLPGLINFEATSMVTGPDGALWFVTGASTLGRITTAGAVMMFPLPFSGAFNIAVGSDGALWITSVFGSSSIWRVTTAGTVTAFPLPRFVVVKQIAPGPDGALWFVEPFESTIGRITTEGVVTEYPTNDGELLGSIVPGPDGALWFAVESYIERITTSGIVTRYLLPEGSTISANGSTLTAGADGAMWFCETNYDGQREADTIGRITTGGVLTRYSVASAPGLVPTGTGAVPIFLGGITSGPDGQIWFSYTYFVSGSYGYGIAKMAIFPGSQLQITSAATLPPGSLNGPYVESVLALEGAWPKIWAVSAGSLPPGLSITSGGQIGGTPTAAGLYTFTLQVTDANMTSATQTFDLTIGPAGCTYAISPAGQIFSAAGGSGSIAVSAPAGCEWTVLNVPSGVTIAGATSGSGNETLTYSVAPNELASSYDSALLIAGYSFVIEQAPAIPPAGPGFLQSLNFVGSMPDVAAQGGWSTIFTLVNKGTQSAVVRTSVFAPDGAPLALPLALPQTLTGPLTASKFDQILAPNASAVMQAFGPYSAPVLAGAAQLAATGAVDGFAIFHFDPSEQEAVVPIETRNAPSYLLAFDNTNGVVTGVAVENVSSQAANIAVIIRDDTGIRLESNSIALNPLGQTSFLLSAQFTSTTNIRGTVEFQTPTGGQISVLGIRYAGTTITTIPVLANVGSGGGQMAHLAVNDGWQTTFALVNAGASSASATLNFFDDNGNPVPLPLTFPQGSPPQTASTLTQTIGPGASLWVESGGALSEALQTGSAQLTTTGDVSGYAIFSFNPGFVQNAQAAVVPMESRNASSYLIAFDNTNQIVTGIAVSSGSSQPVSVAYMIRDATGTQLVTGSLPLPPNGHTSFLLANQYPATADIAGTIEFDTPVGAQISVLGIRSPPALTFTTLPALAK